MPLEPGATFGRYQLAELLGRGGMGEVYSAYDSVLHRKVALKVLTVRPDVAVGAERSPSTDGRARILREARAAAGIAHPNAVAIYDVGEVDDVPFLAMELVAGRTLRAFVGDASISLPRRIRWIIDVARALGAAHKLGLVHRDIKPENVMVRDDGLVKVLDFGIARRAATTGDAGSPTNLSNLASLSALAVTSGTLTADGVVMGTPMYMAPEQLRAGAIDKRADQFAWGVLAHEVLTGKTPWEGEGEGLVILSQILSREVDPLTRRNAEIPGPVDEVVRRALRKEPNARFGTMEEIADELESFAASGAEAIGGPRSSKPAPEVPSAATEQISAAEHSALESAGPRETRTSAPLRGRLLMAIVGLAVTFATVGVVVTRGRTALQAGTPVAMDAGAPPEVPSQMSSHADATEAYEAGMDALHAGAEAWAEVYLGRAIELDPLFGAAQLRHALTILLRPGVSTITSADLQGAHASQASLGTHDRILLDAFELSAREPPDYDAGRKILEAAVERYATDADFPFQLGVLLAFADKPSEALAALDVAIARDAAFAIPWNVKGLIESDLGRKAAATDAFAQCVRVSPRATSCMVNLTDTDVNEGRCADAVVTTRRLIPLEPPEAARPYVVLAEALAGAGEPEDAVRAALRQYVDHLPKPLRQRESTQSNGALAILRGDFRAAEKEYEELERLPETSEDARFVSIYPRVLLSLELGRPAKAIRIADAYLRERAGLTPSQTSGSLTLEAEERAAGALTQEAFAAARDRWLTQDRDTTPAFRWIEAYARPAETREDANAALALMPDMRATHVGLLPYNAEPIGRTFALAGRLDEALPYLVMASSSCALLPGLQAIYATRAAFDLGRALEDRGDVPGACTAYQRVLARWGKASPPPQTATKALARARALGCGP